MRRKPFDLLLISESFCTEPAVELALEAEERGIKSVIMTRTSHRLDGLRAKGLICFRAPDALPELQAAVCARLE
jgi:hypothetical protein